MPFLPKSNEHIHVKFAKIERVNVGLLRASREEPSTQHVCLTKLTEPGAVARVGDRYRVFTSTSASEICEKFRSIDAAQQVIPRSRRSITRAWLALPGQNSNPLLNLF